MVVAMASCGVDGGFFGWLCEFEKKREVSGGGWLWSG